MEMIYITCASMAERAENLVTVARALSRQCHHFLVYLNGYDEPPDELNALPNVGVVMNGEDRGDAGKFYACPKNGYHLTVDDDLYYPDDYVERMIEGVERYGRRYVVSLHGRSFEGPAVRRSYYNGHSHKYRCLGSVEEDVPIHIPGTGVLAYHSSTIDFGRAHFGARNMADIWIGRACQIERVGVVCLAHEEGYLTHQPINMERTIAAAFRNRDQVQARLINELLPWKYYATIPAPEPSRFSMAAAPMP